MKRAFEALAQRRFDIAIVGGGVTGAMLAWEASRRGLAVALVEQDDFCHATSSANSRLIHGGLRYLRERQFGVVLDSLRERRYWLRCAPHWVRPLPFILPCASGKTLSTLRLGLGLYDLLAMPSGLPRAQRLSAAHTLAAMPLLGDQQLAGSLRYFDCQMPYPERIVLAALQGAARNGAVLANYARAEAVLQDASGRVHGLAVRDRSGGERQLEITARQVINAAGPWADQLQGSAGTVQLRHSAGIHLVTPALTGDTALAMQSQGRHFFILPWRGYSLVGTTDTHYTGDPDAYQVSEAEIQALLTTVGDALPGIPLDREKVLYAYGGLRALSVDESGDTYRASRRSEVIDHAAHGAPGLVSVCGGKWTTSRSLAVRVLKRLGLAGKAPTDRLPGTEYDNLDVVHDAARAALPEEPELAAHLVALYGDRWSDLDLGGERLSAREPLLAGQARLAVQSEMALTLADVVFRRTVLGLLGPPPRATLEALAAIMSEDLAWDTARIDREVDGVLARYHHLRAAA